MDLVKTIMTEQAIDTATVKLLSGDLHIDAYLAKPHKQGVYPGVVVLQEIFGVNSHIRSVTERIAKEGYVAVAPALFQRVAPGFETGYTPEDLEVGKKYAWSSKSAELIQDIQAAIDYLKSLPEVKKDGFGCIGFCFGGHVAYLAAASLADIKACASFYGAMITTGSPGGGGPSLALTPGIKGTLYAFFGMEDKSIPAEQVDMIEAELQKCNIPHQVFRYPDADHGFFCDQRKSYNPIAAADAWEKVKQLFTEQLTNN